MSEQPKACLECGSRRKGKRRRGLCDTCYNRLFKRLKALRIEDNLPALRESGRLYFFDSIRLQIKSILSQTESNDSPSLWSEEHLRLPPSKSALRDGRVSWEISPDSVMVLEQLRNPTTRKVVTMYASQSGKSLLLQCAVGYLSQVRGDSIIYGLPSSQLQKTVPLTRFDPLFKLSKITQTKKSNNYVFTSQQTISFVLMSSRPQLQEATARVILVDEITELGSTDFDPLAELDQRTTLFPDSLMWIASTPKQKDKDIHAEWSKSRQHLIEWQCRSCEGWFICEIENIKCDESTSSELILTKHLAFTECPHCGHRHYDNDHRALVLGQRWRCTTPERSTEIMGFRKTRWQTVFKNFSQTLKKKMESAGDMVLEQSFAANWCADPIEMDITDIQSQNLVIKRGQYKRGEFPPDSIGWVFACDVQGDELYCMCVAVSPRGMHNIWTQRIQRDSDQGKVVRALKHLISDRPWSGCLPYLGGAIDAGFSTENVVAWCKEVPQCIPVKGDPKMKGTQPHRTSSDGSMLNINPNFTNDMFQGWVSTGVFDMASDEFDVVGKHIRNEVKKIHMVDGEQVPEWEVLSYRIGNHYRDCARYACVLLQFLGYAKFKTLVVEDIKPVAIAEPPKPPMRASISGILKRRDRY